MNEQNTNINFSSQLYKNLRLYVWRENEVIETYDVLILEKPADSDVQYCYEYWKLQEKHKELVFSKTVSEQDLKDANFEHKDEAHAWFINRFLGMLDAYQNKD